MDKFLRGAAHREAMAAEGRTLGSCSWCKYVGRHRDNVPRLLDVHDPSYAGRHRRLYFPR